MITSARACHSSYGATWGFLPQGFFVGGSSGWQPAIRAPVDHVWARPSGKPMLLTNHPLLYVSARRRWHIVPTGMPSDGLTIPRPLWPLASHPFGPCLLAGLVHDYYCGKALCLEPGRERDMLRRSADDLFGEMVGYLTGSAYIARVWRAAVRAGALATRNWPAAPDYEADLVAAYAREGLAHCVDMTVARIPPRCI